jgi:putative effector of murein hydrolase
LRDERPVSANAIEKASSIARDAFRGMSAHGAGTAKAYQIGREEGTVAGLVACLVLLTSETGPVSLPTRPSTRYAPRPAVD